MERGRYRGECDPHSLALQVMWGNGVYNETDPLEATHGGREPQRVRTAPEYDTPTRVRMWALGDMGTGQHEQNVVRNVAERVMEAEGHPPDMFLALGGECQRDGRGGCQVSAHVQRTANQHMTALEHTSSSSSAHSSSAIPQCVAILDSQPHPNVSCMQANAARM